MGAERRVATYLAALGWKKGGHQRKLGASRRPPSGGCMRLSFGVPVANNKKGPECDQHAAPK